MKITNIALAVVIFSFIALVSIASAEKGLKHQEERQDMPGGGKHYQYDEAKSEEIYKKETTHLNKVQSLVDLMQQQMDAIHAEENPDKRKALMKEHKITMHEAMGMMHGPGGATANKGNGLKHQEERQDMPGGGKHIQITRQMSPERRADLMENHMVIMQQLMSQMMQHQNARQGIPHHSIRQDIPGSSKHMTH